MEEIYKPEDKEADKVELYNRENNDILKDGNGKTYRLPCFISTSNRSIWGNGSKWAPCSSMR